MTGVIAQLRTTDLEGAIRFYTEKLGFALEFRYHFHLYFEIPDADTPARDAKRRGVPLLREPQDTRGARGSSSSGTTRGTHSASANPGDNGRTHG